MMRETLAVPPPRSDRTRLIEREILRLGHRGGRRYGDLTRLAKTFGVSLSRISKIARRMEKKPRQEAHLTDVRARMIVRGLQKRLTGLERRALRRVLYLSETSHGSSKKS